MSFVYSIYVKLHEQLTPATLTHILENSVAAQGMFIAHKNEISSAKNYLTLDQVKNIILSNHTPPQQHLFELRIYDTYMFITIKTNELNQITLDFTLSGNRWKKKYRSNIEYIDFQSYIRIALQFCKGLTITELQTDTF